MVLTSAPPRQHILRGVAGKHVHRWLKITTLKVTSNGTGFRGSTESVATNTVARLIAKCPPGLSIPLARRHVPVAVLLKKRSVITKTQYGGKACPNLSVTRRCNSQKCVVAQCHSKQMSCKVRAHYYGRTKCAVGYKKRCAQCDSKSECSQPRVMHAVQVTQSRDMMHLGNVGFKCSSVSGKCVCRCNNHPIACFKKNSVFSARSRTMLGNIYRSTTMQKCSTLCNHHTSCVGWVFTSKNKCYLHTGKAEFVKNGNSNITTYAGLKSGVNGCVVPKAKTCGVHEYLKVIKRPHGDAYFCVECPAGKFLHYTAHSKTKCHSRVQQQISRP
jgi:hypothetical protein